MIGRPIRVTRTDTGEKWASLSEAARALYVGASSLGYAFRKGKTHVCGIPLKFEETDGYTLSRPVRCKETGAVYSSAAEASRAIGLSPTAVSSSIYQSGTGGGYHWEYVEHNDGVYEI